MAAAFPEAEIHATLYQPKTTNEEFRDLNIHISPLNRIETLRNDHRLALPLFPLVTQRLKIDADVLNPTCEFFDRPQAVEIAKAIDRFEQTPWDSRKITAHVESFGVARFGTELRAAESLLP